MLSSSPPPALGEQSTYTRSVFEAILAGMGWGSPAESEYACDDAGAWVKQVETAQTLAWHPLCELMAPGSPNPLDAPWLPFPFTARQLAALMVSGWGYFIQEKYGDWENGPDPDELGSIDQLGGKAREALTAAYVAYREALELAPKLDKSLAIQDRDLVDRYRHAREEAAIRERLTEADISADEYTARLARIAASVEDLHLQVLAARKVANDAESSWRRAIVQHLLLPIDMVPAAAFDCSMLRALPPERRAQALHQQRAQLEFESSAEGQAHWALVSEQFDLEREVRRWQLMNPQTVTEAVLHDAKLKELEGRLADVRHRLNHWTWIPEVLAGAAPEIADAPPASTLEHESADDRQRRRLQDLRQRFGGDWVRRDGKWTAKDRQSGAFRNLVIQESANGSKNVSEKSVRADLAAAAEAEAAERRASRWPTGQP